MKVKDIIATALRYIGRDDLSPTLLSEDFSEDSLNTADKDVVNTLLFCFNSVEDELARCYIPVRTEEVLTSENGVYDFAGFSMRPLKIISVKSKGRNVKYTLTPKTLVCGRNEISVEYGYAPLKKGLDDDSEFSSVCANDRIIAAGTASEYCLIDGEAQLARTWESVYRGEIEALQHLRLGDLHMPPRRWV